MNPFEQVAAICKEWGYPAPEEGEQWYYAMTKVAACMSHLSEVASRHGDLNK